MIDFSKQLSIEELYKYVIDVDAASTKILKSLSYEDTKIKISLEKKTSLEKLNVVSQDENAIWLICPGV